MLPDFAIDFFVNSSVKFFELCCNWNLELDFDPIRKRQLCLASEINSNRLFGNIPGFWI